MNKREEKKLYRDAAKELIDKIDICLVQSRKCVCVNRADSLLRRLVGKIVKAQ